MLRLQEMYEQIRDIDLTLIAGKGGLNRLVRWFHMVENTEIAAFLEGNELVFTTGAGLKEEGDLLRLVKAVYFKDAAGIVVNIGPYIPQVSVEVLDFCNSYGLPLFVCPWEVHMAQIMRRLSRMLAQTEQLESGAEAAFACMLRGEQPDAGKLWTLQKHGFSEDSVCRLALVDAPRFAVGAHGQENEADFLVSELEGHSVLIFNTPEASAALRQLSHLRRLLQHGCLMVLGEQTTLSEIAAVYRRCERLFGLLKNRASIWEQTVEYERSGVWQLLLGIEDSRILESFYRSSLGKLVDYDHRKGGQLLSVLEIYLKSGGSLKAAAEQTGLHKNTVTNRIHRAEELLGGSLDNRQTRLILEMGLLTKELLESGV